MTPLFQQAAVVGLGLIGGSIARDLTAAGATVSAFDADPAQLEAAERDGIVARRLSAALEDLGDPDLVVIAVPVDQALDVLRCVAARGARRALITDVGSTKGSIVSLAEDLGLADRFVGSHPMAGDHRSGWDASRAGLFVDAPVYLCAPRDCPADAVARAHALWHRLGARTIVMDAELHDEKLAWTSHLPHMVSVVLALALDAGGVQRDELGPGGRDMTRIAGSSPDMWTSIAIDNADAIEAAVAIAERELRMIRGAIVRRDSAALRSHFGVARRWMMGV